MGRLLTYSFQDTRLRYAYQDAAGWHMQTVDSGGQIGWGTSLAVDGSGYPHISYYDGTNGDLKYVYRDASGWHIQVVDSKPHAPRRRLRLLVAWVIPCYT